MVSVSAPLAEFALIAFSLIETLIGPLNWTVLRVPADTLPLMLPVKSVPLRLAVSVPSSTLTSPPPRLALTVVALIETLRLMPLPESVSENPPVMVSDPTVMVSLLPDKLSALPEPNESATLPPRDAAPSVALSVPLTVPE